MFDLENRIAVVSGASSGLGRQIARALAKQGANLVILARRFERLEALKSDLRLHECIASRNSLLFFTSIPSGTKIEQSDILRLHPRENASNMLAFFVHL